MKSTTCDIRDKDITNLNHIESERLLYFWHFHRCQLRLLNFFKLSFQQIPFYRLGLVITYILDLVNQNLQPLLSLVQLFSSSSRLPPHHVEFCRCCYLALQKLHKSVKRGLFLSRSRYTFDEDDDERQALSFQRSGYHKKNKKRFDYCQKTHLLLLVQTKMQIF